MKLLRTPDERFENLPDYPFEPNYIQVDEEGLSIRLHYVDEGAKDAPPFKRGQFDFAFDFGCFHHVGVKDRVAFIEGVYEVLRHNGRYLLVCFSHKNGPAWNHFTREQIVELFGNYFEIEWIKHVSSLEGDKITRYFYEVLMEKSRAFPKMFGKALT